MFSKYSRLKEFEEAGLIEIDKEKRIHQTKYVRLTKEGEEVARRLSEIHDILPYDECDGEDY